MNNGNIRESRRFIIPIRAQSLGFFRVINVVIRGRRDNSESSNFYPRSASGFSRFLGWTDRRLPYVREFRGLTPLSRMRMQVGPLTQLTGT